MYADHHLNTPTIHTYMSCDMEHLKTCQAALPVHTTKAQKPNNNCSGKETLCKHNYWQQSSQDVFTHILWNGFHLPSPGLSIFVFNNQLLNNNG